MNQTHEPIAAHFVTHCRDTVFQTVRRVFGFRELRFLDAHPAKHGPEDRVPGSRATLRHGAFKSYRGSIVFRLSPRAIPNVRRSVLVVILLWKCTACHPAHPEHLTTYARMDEPTEIRTLARRSALVKTVSGSGTLELTQPNGNSVVLDVAVVLQMPNQARLRAWKMGQAVFDLTVTLGGVWLETSQRGERKSQVISAGDNAARVTRGLSLLSGGFFDDPNLAGVDQGNELILRQQRQGEPAIICRVDRDTLTPRQFRMVDSSGVERFTLNLGEYADSTGLLWPRKMTAISSTGKIVVSLDDLEINGDIPAGAFTPPVRAEKLP